MTRSRSGRTSGDAVRPTAGASLSVGGDGPVPRSRAYTSAHRLPSVGSSSVAGVVKTTVLPSADRRGAMLSASAAVPSSRDDARVTAPLSSSFTQVPRVLPRSSGPRPAPCDENATVRPSEDREASADRPSERSSPSGSEATSSRPVSRSFTKTSLSEEESCGRRSAEGESKATLPPSADRDGR